MIDSTTHITMPMEMTIFDAATDPRRLSRVINPHRAMPTPEAPTPVEVEARAMLSNADRYPVLSALGFVFSPGSERECYSPSTCACPTCGRPVARISTR